MGKKWVTGTVSRKGALEWTVLRHGKEGWECVASGEGLPQEGAEGWDAADVKRWMGSWKGKVGLALGGECGLTWVQLLPSGDAEDLRGMAELQAEERSPLGDEEGTWGYEALEQGEGNTLTALTVAKRSAVEEAGAPFLANGILPDGVDTAALAWWWCLKSAGAAEGRGDGLVVRVEEDGEAGLIVTRDGAALAFRPLPRAEGEGTAEEWGEEIAYALTTLEGEWGELNAGLLQVWVPDGREAEWQERSAELGRIVGAAETQVRRHGEAPKISEGVARRLAEGGGVNLAPEAWGEAEASRMSRRRMLRTAAVFAAVWLLAVGAFLAGLNWRRNELARLETQVAAVEGPALEVRRLRTKLREFESYADRSRSALESLRVISEALPDGIKFSSMVYRKGASVVLRGEAQETEGIYRLQRNLEASGMFTDVKSDGITMKGGGAGEYVFGLTLSFTDEGDEGAEGGES